MDELSASEERIFRAIAEDPLVDQLYADHQVGLEREWFISDGRIVFPGSSSEVPASVLDLISRRRPLEEILRVLAACIEKSHPQVVFAGVWSSPTPVAERPVLFTSHLGSCVIETDIDVSVLWDVISEAYEERRDSLVLVDGAGSNCSMHWFLPISPLSTAPSWLGGISLMVNENPDRDLRSEMTMWMRLATIAHELHSSGGDLEAAEDRTGADVLAFDSPSRASSADLEESEGVLRLDSGGIFAISLHVIGMAILALGTLFYHSGSTVANLPYLPPFVVAILFVVVRIMGALRNDYDSVIEKVRTAQSIHRATTGDREAIEYQLSLACNDGRLKPEEYRDRVDIAWQVESRRDLWPLVYDVYDTDKYSRGHYRMFQGYDDREARMRLANHLKLRVERNRKSTTVAGNEARSNF